MINFLVKKEKTHCFWILATENVNKAMEDLSKRFVLVGKNPIFYYLKQSKR